MLLDEQNIEKWKEKYYDQLDQLETREKDWAKLEATLKHTIGRISLAAEGQNSHLDRHLSDLRQHLKDNIERTRLEAIVSDISHILSQLEESQTAPDKSAISVLEQLISSLDLQKTAEKPLKKLLKQFSNSTDAQYDALLKDSIKLLKTQLSHEPADPEKNKSSFLNRIFHTEKNESSDHSTSELPSFTTTLASLLSLIPWPEPLSSEAILVIQVIGKSTDEKTFETSLQQLEQVLRKWPSKVTGNHPPDNEPDISQLETYRSCIIEMLNTLDNPQSPNGKLTALKISARDAQNKQELSKLITQLPQFIPSSTMVIADDNSPSNEVPILAKTLVSPLSDPLTSSVRPDTEFATNTAFQPSIQELLIRLLEQLTVPSDLHNDVDKMKHRLSEENEPADWKLLLKDVAVLINSIRSRMQKEKHEFEHFLQQVTDRLKTMDQFLQIETTNLQQAETQGNNFDIKMHSNVDEIRQNVNDATELSSLKQNVSAKLDTISKHIKNYRETENKRIQASREQVNTMHSRLQTLEHETNVLKKEVIEKNRQAMFDTLTGIPNRLSYEKKIEEEISRWKRFKNPLSLAIWDIDFFKKVNDTYGHKAGDKVLKTVAQLLHKRIRSTDFLARYGGEEFVMLLPGTRQEETLRLMNELREQVENCGFHYHGDSVKITVSCGISSFNEKDSLSQVFERADRALYKAKGNGRNQCIAAACLSD